MSTAIPPTGRARVPGGDPSQAYPRGRAAVSSGGHGTDAGSARGTARPGAPDRNAGHGDGGSGWPPSGGRPPRTGPRPRWGRIALVVGAALLAIVLVVVIGGLLYGRSLDSKLGRTDPFAQVTGGRPAKTVSGAINMLLLGSDSRDPENKAKAGQWRTDTIMLLHVPASHDHAYLISIPRDLYVYIPQSPTNANFGDTHSKINAAFAWGGLPLMVETVEGYTGVRIDHVALIDFGGFQQVTDALGGVDMYIDQSITSIHPPHRHFTKGMNHLDGAQALDYVRQRYQFADGDFARMHHQQQFLKAIMSKAASTGTLSNPFKLNAFLQAMTKAMTVDKQFSLVDMAMQFHSLRSSDLTFMTSPNGGSQMVGDQSVVVSDRTKALSLYNAVNKDQVAAWIKQNPGSTR